MLEETFTQKQLDSLEAQTWRAKAFSDFQNMPLPSPKEETWRYTDLTKVDFDSVAPLGKTAHKVKSENVEQPEKTESPLTTPTDKLDAWTAAFGNVLSFNVPAGKKARLDLQTVPKKSSAVLLMIRLEKGAQLDFLERFSGGKNALFGQQTVFELAENARVNYASVQQFDRDVLSFATKTFHLGRDASVSCFHADSGARLSRTVVRQHFDGDGARSENNKAVFFGSQNQHFDLTTEALHHAKHTKSDISIRGALSGKASAVYRGIIRIDKDARHTDSYLQDRVLHLNPGVVSNSIPSLFIDNNDVKASHGATVSKVSPEALFYLQSRGLGKRQAEKLMVTGFLSELFPDFHADKTLKNKVLQDWQQKALASE